MPTFALSTKSRDRCYDRKAASHMIAVLPRRKDALSSKNRIAQAYDELSHRNRRSVKKLCVVIHRLLEDAEQKRSDKSHG